MREQSPRCILFAIRAESPNFVARVVFYLNKFISIYIANKLFIRFGVN